MEEPAVKRRFQFSLMSLVWICSLGGAIVLLVLAQQRIARLERRNAKLKAENEELRKPWATRLGPPLGTIITIEGVREEGVKVGSYTLRVDTVEGHRLDNPVLIRIEISGSLPSDGVRCEMTGYESGRYVGAPFEICLSQQPFQFQPYFVPIRIKRPADMPLEGYKDR